MLETIHFLNLTNGIEAIQRYELIYNIQFIRIQSCYIEENLYEDILIDLDHNFLMSLALGKKCIVYDFGAKAKTSKAIYIGIEWVRYVLNKRWFAKETRLIIKNKDVTEYFYKTYYTKLTKRTKKRIDYYKKFLLTENLNLLTITDSTTNDNKPEIYKEIIKGYILQ